VSNQEGLDPKDFDDLIARLSRRKQETPTAQIPFQDVKDILQQEGLLESLLKEHVSSQNQAVEAVEQKNKKQRSLLTKGFTALSVALAGLSGFGGYSIGSKFAAENASQSSVTTQNAFSEKIKFSKPKLVI
jgi:ATP-dependent Clp protease ATP-binding subunit ClpA